MDIVSILGFDPTFGMSKEQLEFMLKCTASALTIGLGLGGGLGYFGARRKLSSGEFRDDFEIQFVSFEEESDGRIAVEFESQWEGKLEKAMRSPALAKRVSNATRGKVGKPILIPKHHVHALMMGRIEGLLTGADPRANAAASKGRKTHTDKFGFGVVFLEEDLSGDGHNDNAVIRVFVIDDRQIAILRSDMYVQRLYAPKTRHSGWIKPLVALARAAKPEGAGHGGENVVWYTEIKTSYGAGDFMSAKSAAA